VEQLLKDIEDVDAEISQLIEDRRGLIHQYLMSKGWTIERGEGNFIPFFFYRKGDFTALDEDHAIEHEIE